jgi:hypothetical protein
MSGGAYGGGAGGGQYQGAGGVVPDMMNRMGNVGYQPGANSGLNRSAVQSRPMAKGGYLQPGYQGQQSNVNPWSGYTPAQAYPGNNMQNFLNLYQYPPFNRARFTNQPQAQPIPPGGTQPPPGTGGGGNVPPPGTQPPPGWTGGSPTGSYTGIPTQNPLTPSGTPVYGTPGNTPGQNQSAAREMGNPLAPPGNATVTTPSIQNPTTAPQNVFNDILSKYGQNAAMSFALSNRGTMGNVGIDQLAGLDPMTRNQAVNTYSPASKSSDLGGNARYDLSSMGNPFDPNSPIARYRAQLRGG